MPTIALLGDISLNGAWSVGNRTLFSRPLMDEIASHDLILLNLESPVRGDGTENLLKNPRLCTSAEAIRSLAGLKPSACVLGNNHIGDHLASGLQRTMDAVRMIGARSVGAGTSAETAQAPLRMEIGDTPVSVLSFVGAETNPNIPPEAGVHVNALDIDAACRDVNTERCLGRVVIVSLHWGIENMNYPAPWQRRAARALSIAGAHLIWGHHSHTCQGWEIVEGTPVFYSLGNAVFGDLEGFMHWPREGRRGQLVSCTITEEGVDAESIRVVWFERARSDGPAEEVRLPEVQHKLCAPFRRPAYSLFYLSRKSSEVARRVRHFVSGDGKRPLRQLGRLPARILKEITG